jgi:hypothetical protein
MTVSFHEPIRFARKGNSYSYRKGFAMVPCAEEIVFHDDFNEAVTTNVPTGWAAAIIDTGATLTQAAADGLSGGVIKIASDGTLEGVSIYMPKQIQLSANRFYMEVRFKTVDADDTDFQFGLTDVGATTNPEDLWTTTAADVIAFGVLDGDATPGLLCDKDNAGTSVQLASGTTFDILDDTWTTMAILVEGNSTDSNMQVHGFVNGNLALSWATETSIPDDVILAPFIGARTGGDAGHTIHIDYVRFSQERP